MTLRIRGPRADAFVTLLARYSGRRLVRDAATDLVTIDRDGLINPFVAPSLQALVERMISQPENVTITARGGMRGFLVDQFDRMPAVQIAARSVFVSNLDTLERLDPQFCAAVIAHFMGEYDHAAVQQAPNQFDDAHVAGLRAEAQVIHELTGRPIFNGNARPWERSVALPAGRTRVERRYGPGNVYFVLLGAPPTQPILAVSRSQ